LFIFAPAKYGDVSTALTRSYPTWPEIRNETRLAFGSGESRGVETDGEGGKGREKGGVSYPRLRVITRVL